MALHLRGKIEKLILAYADESSASSGKVMHKKVGFISVGAFTLIELLVVIAIIALLMAILIPVLGRARDQARTISCRSNPKQYGIGMRMYLDDNDFKFPTRNEWMSSVEGTENWLTKGDTPNGTFWPYVKAEDCHMCPRFAQLVKGDLTYGNTAVSYLLNSYVGNNGNIWSSWLGAGVRGVTKEMEVYRPAAVVLFAEENTFTIPGYSNYPYNDNLLTIGNAARQIDNYATYHNSSSSLENGGTNICFVDGHVELYKRPNPDELDAGFRLAWPKKELPY